MGKGDRRSPQLTMARVLTEARTQVSRRRRFGRQTAWSVLITFVAVAFAYRWPWLAGVAVFALMGLPRAWRRYHLYRRRARGSEAIARILRQLPGSFVVINDLTLAIDSRRQITIDHLVIGPRGVMIIEANHQQGHFVQDHGHWFQVEGQRYERIPSLTARVTSKAEAVAIHLKALRLEEYFQAPLSLLNVIPLVVMTDERVTMRTSTSETPVITLGELRQFVLGQADGQGLAPRECVQIGQAILRTRGHAKRRKTRVQTQRKRHRTAAGQSARRRQLA